MEKHRASYNYCSSSTVKFCSPIFARFKACLIVWEPKKRPSISSRIMYFPVFSLIYFIPWASNLAPTNVPTPIPESNLLSEQICPFSDLAVHVKLPLCGNRQVAVQGVFKFLKSEKQDRLMLRFCIQTFLWWFWWNHNYLASNPVSIFFATVTGLSEWSYRYSSW